MTTNSGPILIFGANGQLGFELRRSLAPIEAMVALNHAGCDITDSNSVRTAIKRYRPSLIVNAAAYTSVDRAEEEADIAHAANAVAPGVMADEAAHIGARLIHYSTDYVFDGESDEPYRETDEAEPQSVYGRSKLEGEQRIIASQASYLILRTSWVAGAHGGNFVKTILRLARERDELHIVSDQIGAPTTAALLADITARILARVGRDADMGERGLYHITSSGSASWYDYARYIVSWCRDHDVLLKTTPDAVQPITTAQYPLPAARPKNSRLDTRKACVDFDLALPPWQQNIDLLLEQIV